MGRRSDQGSPLKAGAERAGLGSSWSEEWTHLSLNELYEWEKAYLSKEQRAAAREQIANKVTPQG